MKSPELKVSLKEGTINKILIGVLITLISAFIGWGTWVTTNAYAINNLKLATTKNEQKIADESKNRQKQIKERMDKQDILLQNQDKKLSDIYMLLINMDKKENNN